MTSSTWLKKADATNLSIHNFINGEFCAISPDEAKPRMIEKHSPRDGRLLYSFPEGNQRDVDAAVANAREAFEDGRWSDKSMPERVAILNKLADLIDENAEQLAGQECLDVGKPIAKAEGYDLPVVSGRIRNVCADALQMLAPSGADLGYHAYQCRTPAGVVGGIAAWNFPLCVTISKVAPALVMGNSIVLKPSEFTPLSVMLLAKLAVDAGVPPGVFNVVQGAGQTVGAALVAHNDVNLVSFVGSTATGRAIMSSAGQSNMKRVILECGGKSPYLVFDDCHEDLDYLAQDIVDTAFANQGQLCVAGTRLLIQDSMREKLLPLIVKKAQELQPNDPQDPNTGFGALINEAHMNKVLGYIQSGTDEGAELLTGGKQVVPQDNSELAGGFYIEPTIFDQVKPGFKIEQEEIFGPVLSVVTFKDEEEAIRIANGTCFGLASYAATTDLGRAMRLGRKIQAGALTVLGTNNPTGGGINISHEKQKQSGMGWSGGVDGLAAYTVTTGVHILT